MSAAASRDANTVELVRQIPLRRKALYAGVTLLLMTACLMVAMVALDVYLHRRVQNVGGLNVYPREIEDVLLQHPLVRDAAVVGVRHVVRGETIVAYVTLIARADDTSGARAAIREHLREHLPGYKVPRRLEIVDEIPKTLIGKPLRRILREEAQRAEPSIPDATPAHGDGPPGCEDRTTQE